VGRGSMTKRFNKAKIAFALIAALALLAVILSPTQELPPAKVSITFLGYTNGPMGPCYGVFAITNRSSLPISFEGFYHLEYARHVLASPQVTSIEPGSLQVTRLRPGAGFVQNIFVFPGDGDFGWRLTIRAFYSSTSMRMFRALETWLKARGANVTLAATHRAVSLNITEWFGPATNSVPERWP
jgi:hypothetical protein